MVYRGPVVRYRPKLGLKPTPADHAFVASLSLLRLGEREIARRLGMRFGLGKPLARSTMYHHFKADLVPAPRGRKPATATVKARANADLAAELRREMTGVKDRGRAK